jgi:hypothetical protein
VSKNDISHSTELYLSHANSFTLAASCQVCLVSLFHIQHIMCFCINHFYGSFRMGRSFIGELPVVNVIFTLLVFHHVKNIYVFNRGRSTWNIVSYHTILYIMRKNGPPPHPNVICYAVNSVITSFVFYNINGWAWDINISIWQRTDAGSSCFLNWTPQWIIECFKHECWIINSNDSRSRWLKPTVHILICFRLYPKFTWASKGVNTDSFGMSLFQKL